MQRVEKVYDTLSQLVFQVKFLALGYLLSTRDQVACPVVNVLQEILSGGLEQ